MPQRLSSTLLLIASLTLVYFVAGKLGLTLAVVNISATAVWPPTGIALAACLLLGYRVWPAILLGAFLVNVTTSGVYLTSLSIAVGNTLEALLGAYLINRLANGRRVFDRAQDIFKFAVLAGILSTGVSATWGVTSLALGGLETWANYLPVWLTWWLGDAAGALIVAPVLILWATPPSVSWHYGPGWGAAVLLLPLVFLGLAVWGGLPLQDAQTYLLELIILPAVLWAAFRFGQRGAATATLILSGIALWATLQGWGPFSRSTPNESLLLLQIFMSLIAVTGLGLAAVVAERQQSEASLRQSHTDLERRVEERTASFSKAIASLEREVAERKQVEAALRQSEERFARAFRASSAALSISTLAEGRFIDVNDSFLRLMGYERDEVIGHTVAELDMRANSDDRVRTAQLLRDQGSVRDLETQFRRKSGEVRDALSSMEMIEIEGEPCLLAIDYDITERKRAEAALRESEERYRAVTQFANDAIISADEQGNIISWNHGAHVIFGYTEADVLGQPLTLLMPQRYHALHREGLARVLAGGEQHVIGRTVELHGRRKNGSEFPVELSLAMWESRQGRFFTGILRDITARRRAVEALHHQMELYNSLVKAQSDLGEGVAVTEGQRIIYANEALADIYGYSVDEILALPSFLDLIAPEEQERMWHRLQERMTEANPSDDGQAEVQRTDGRRIVIEYSLKMVQLGERTQLISIIRDITERTQTEATLRQLAAIVESSDDAIISQTLDGVILSWNQGAERLYGYGAEEARGRSISILAPPEHLAEFTDILAKVRRGESVEYFETNRLRKDGKRIDVALTAFPIKDAKGTIVGGSIVARDITAQKQAERALKEAHAKLSHSLTELEQRSHELTLLSLLNEMSDLLQSCLTPEEAYTVIARFAHQLFPNQAGALYVLNPSNNFVELVASWGAFSAGIEEQAFIPDECWALRRGRIHRMEDRSDLLCQHVARSDLSADSASYLCVPMMAQGESLGILHVRSAARPDDASQLDDQPAPLTDSQQALAVSVAEHVALALANLKLRETLRNQSIRDPLTNLFNRRYMEESLEREVHRAIRQAKPLSVIMIDIDYFKRYNDANGHDAGDTLLQSLGRLLQTHIRGEDIACRYGGEEFTLILPETSLEVASQRAEHLREQVRYLQVRHRTGMLVPVTLSLGVATYPQHSQSSTSLLQAADAALYRAKQGGRNRVAIADSLSDSPA